VWAAEVADPNRAKMSAVDGPLSGLRPPDTEVAVAPHRDACLEVGEVNGDADPFDGMPDRARRLVVEADYQDVGVGAWRVGPYVTQTPIQRQQQSVISCRTSQHRRVLRTAEPLGPCRIHVVADVTQDGDD
jgi:hypothetical protein